MLHHDDGISTTTGSQASGQFDVKLTPLGEVCATVNAMKIEKVFHGDLDGTSEGQMLGARYPDSSGGYVAMERVTATLADRQGSFTLQHDGLMDHGAQSLTVTVVPGSATDGLTGLVGSMSIIVTEGRHDYEFAYTLPDQEG